jgi:putative ABC transport system ATP-binding protein
MLLVSAASFDSVPTPPAAPARAVIQLSQLGKVFQTEDIETHALSNIHLNVDPGDFLAIIGPSGSGKTTLLAILGLMERPTTGQFSWQGREVSGLGDRELSRLRNEQVGFIFQTFNLIGDLSVEQNVELPLVYRRMLRAERRERVAQALGRVGMGHRARHRPGQLSGGQQQRVAVARALVGDPAILLADEPTGNLDSVNGESIMDLISELHAMGSTICMVTHNLEFARRARRTLRLADGRIVDEHL